MNIDAANFRHCWDCKKIISRNAKTCPCCGSKTPDGGVQTLIILSLFSILSGSWLFFKPTDFWGMVCIAVGFFIGFAAWKLNDAGKVTNMPKDEPKEDQHDKNTLETGHPMDMQYEHYYKYNEPEITQYWETKEQVKVPAEIKIDYIDAKGESTERTIEIERYDGSCYVKAFCGMRQEYRTFRIDRIKNAIDTETGEAIDHLPDHLLKKYKSTSEYKLNRTFEKAADVIKILYYVGKSDSQLRKEELTIISDLIRKIAKDDTISDEVIKKRLNKIPVPSPQAFKLAVDRVYKKSPKNLKIVKNIVKKIIETQKTVHQSEQDALDFIDKKLDEPSKATNKSPVV